MKIVTDPKTGEVRKEAFISEKARMQKGETITVSPEEQRKAKEERVA